MNELKKIVQDMRDTDKGPLEYNVNGWIARLAALIQTHVLVPREPSELPSVRSRDVLAGWVRCGSRLPESSGAYACVTTRHETWQKVFFDADRKRWEGQTRTMQVTHWVSVPDLPANAAVKRPHEEV